MIWILLRKRRAETYPLASRISLEIFIFLVVPLYNSSRLHGSLFSMGAAFRGCDAPSPAPPKEDPKKSSLNIPIRPGNLDPALALPAPPPIPPNGVENPKNSAKISSALRGLNLNEVGPSPPLEKKAAPPGPPAPGGGTWPLSPASPYWS